MLSAEDISPSERLRANRLSGEMTAIRLNDAIKRRSVSFQTINACLIWTLERL